MKLVDSIRNEQLPISSFVYWYVYLTQKKKTKVQSSVREEQLQSNEICPGKTRFKIERNVIHKNMNLQISILVYKNATNQIDTSNH